MIKRIDNANELDSYNKVDLYSIRIKSLLKAYGVSYDFASYYIQIDDNNLITAILSKLDGDFTISHLDSFNADELVEFLNVIGFNSCLIDDVDLPFDYSTGITMKSFNKVEKNISYCEIDEYPKLMDLFNLDDYDKVDFESWYVDVSHRVRHECAKAYSLLVNNEIISSAIFSSIYDDNAIITAVNTDPTFRRMGYGSSLVSYMIMDIRGDVYLMRDENKNKEFYEKLGFKDIGRWRLYR